MKIVNYPHPALRHKSITLTSIDNSLRKQAAEMLDIMYQHKGLGLAANQVALPYRMFVMNFSGDPEEKEAEFVMVNPVILDRKGSMDGEEGCLSFPELFQKVRRPRTIRAQAYNLKGELIEVTWNDLPSRVFQHELDHLDGVLFIDKFGTIGKMSSRSTVKHFEKVYKQAQEKGTMPSDEEIIAELKRLEEECGKAS